MSNLDLRILLIGWDANITTVGNALLGKEAFNKDDKVTQRHSVQLQDRRNLHVTAPIGGQFVLEADDRWRLKDELVTEIKSIDCHAVVFAVEFNANLDMMGNYVFNIVQLDNCFRDLISKKGVIVIREADTFRQAQLSESFPQWMAKQGGEVGQLLELVQRRCLIFDTGGDQDVLVAQRNEFIDMIDERVLGWKLYTGQKFIETEQKFTQLEQQLLDLNQRITLKTSELDQQEKTNFCELKEMNQLLKTNLLEISTEVKENIQEFSKQLATNLREATTKSEDTGRKLLELKENFGRENTERTIALNEVRERSAHTEQQLSEYKENFDRENTEKTVALNEVRERSAHIEQQLSEYKENFDRENTERTIALNEVRERSVDTDRKLLELQENFDRENTERSLALNEMRDRSAHTEQQLSEYKKNFDRENAERAIALNEVRDRSVETDKKLLELQENFDKENAERTIAIDEERKKLRATRNLLSDLQKKVREKRGSDEALYQQVETNSRQIIKLRDDTEKYISELKHQTLKEFKEEEGASNEELKDVQKSSVWEQIKSLNQSVPNLTSPWKMSLLLLVVLVPILLFLTPFPLPGLSANTKEITFLDESQDLRRYMDAKFEQVTKKFQAIEKQLTDNKIQQMVKDKISKKHKTDSEIADRESQSVVKLFTELKEQLVNETSEKMESLSKTTPRSSIIWGMIQSLPMSLPLVLSWTLLLLLIVPVRVPIPWGHVLAALLVSLLILQLILILLLLGM